MTNVKKQQGFTLIEVTLVIGIISLVSGFVLNNIAEAKQKAEDVKMVGDSNQVELAMALYKDQKGSYPQHDGNKTKMYKEGDAEFNEAMNELISEGFLAQIPTSPSGDRYAYFVSENGQKAVFAVSLNNERTGGGNSSNSCSVVEQAQQSGPFTSCSYTGISGSNVDCDDYNHDEESEYCFVVVGTGNPGGTIDFCDTYNQNGGVSDIDGFLCECTEDDLENPFASSCGTYGGWPNSEFGAFDSIYSCQRTATDAVCSGSSNSDYCKCLD